MDNVSGGNIIILTCVFMSNQALLSAGGAINLVNSNLVLKNSKISSNKALIGGGVYYQQIAPDFVLDLKQGINNSNIISENFAFLMGKIWVQSTLRSINIQANDIISSEKTTLSENQNGGIQINVSMQWDQQNQQIQITGELQSKQFIEDGFNLDIYVMYKPLSQLVFLIASNSFSQLYDSKGEIYMQQSQFYKNNNKKYFDECQLGQSTKRQSDSIYCQDCPEGKLNSDNFGTPINKTKKTTVAESGELQTFFNNDHQTINSEQSLNLNFKK
ncbi:hypothetical protein ABPG72_000297 [Tetrahymena utriculariae]